MIAINNVLSTERVNPRNMLYVSSGAEYVGITQTLIVNALLK